MASAQQPTPLGEAGRWWAIRQWSLWQEPVSAVAYIATVVTLWLGLVAFYGIGMPGRLHDVLLFAILLVCSAVCVEGTRRLGQSAGVVRDLVFAWGIPVALLLPPAYALVFFIPVAAHFHLRVKRGPFYRRVVSAISQMLACGVASIVFHLSLPEAAMLASPAWLTRPEIVLPVALACGALCVFLQETLLSLAVHWSASSSRGRDSWDGEVIRTDLVEACVGVLVAIAAATWGPAVVLALPPVLLLQRSLVHAQLREAARTDTKTGLLNAGTWQVEAEREIVRASRTGQLAALLLIDIDHFKRINDGHGHLLGDEVLVALADLMGRHLRQYDLLGRFGGEEFVVLLPEADAAEAYYVAERLRRHAATLAVPAEPGEVKVTISVGVSLLGVHGGDLRELVASADIALYHAKHTGRDRVCLPAGDGISPDGSGRAGGTDRAGAPVHTPYP